MRLILVMPAWRRFDVTRLVLAQRAHLRGVLAERGVEAVSLIVADDDNIDIAREMGCETLERPNEPLGAKWNDGLEHACRELDADFVTVVGSDDWVHPDLFDRLPAEVAPHPVPTDENPVVICDGDAPEAVTGRELALVDLPTGRLRRCVSRGRWGVIPWVFPVSALEPSGCRPVKDGASKGLDGSLAAGLGVSPSWVFHDPNPVARVDFKSGTNLNSFDLIAGAIGVGETLEPWDLLGGYYPPALVDQARGLAEAMA